MQLRLAGAARRAFTLVELLVVITIIGILMALLLPAVQAARESARRIQCSDNIKQLGLAALSFESAHGYLPTGGWGCEWLGDPDHGFGWKQPGGWIFNVLPQLEQSGLHDLQSGTTGAARQQALTTMIETPLSVINCPTRRPLATYPTSSGAYNICPQFPSGPPQVNVAKSDYAGNGGDDYTDPSWTQYFGGWGPTSYANGSTGPALAAWGVLAKTATGVIYAAAQLPLAQVTDGTSNTYLIGEKYLDPNYYFNGQDNGDNETAYTGDNEDLCRWGGPITNSDGITNGPQQDTPGPAINHDFGSAHATGFGMAMCDGSVRVISFSIDTVTHGHLCNRHDGVPIDPTKY